MSQYTLESALEELKLQAGIHHQGEVSLVIKGDTYLLGILCNEEGLYEALVSQTNYGMVKTVRGALGAIKRRVEFLQTEANPKPVDYGALEAIAIDAELKRRKKNWG